MVLIFNRYTRFKRIFLLTQQDCLETVLDNLFYAYQLKIPVKINCVMDDTFHLKRLNDLMDLIKDKKLQCVLLNSCL